IFFQSLLSGARSIGAACLTAVSTVTVDPWLLEGRNDFTASAIARTCAGVVPQQPPRIRTPAPAASRANNAKYSGEDFGYTMRSPSRFGKHAFAMPLTRRSSM